MVEPNLVRESPSEIDKLRNHFINLEASRAKVMIEQGETIGKLKVIMNKLIKDSSSYANRIEAVEKVTSEIREKSPSDSMLKNIDNRLANALSRLEDEQYGQVTVEGRLEKVESVLEILKDKVGNVDNRLLNVEGQLGNVKEKLTNLEGKIDGMMMKVDSVDYNIKTIGMNMEKNESTVTEMLEEVIKI